MWQNKSGELFLFLGSVRAAVWSRCFLFQESALLYFFVRSDSYQRFQEAFFAKTLLRRAWRFFLRKCECVSSKVLNSQASVSLSEASVPVAVAVSDHQTQIHMSKAIKKVSTMHLRKRIFNLSGARNDSQHLSQNFSRWCSVYLQLFSLESRF